MKIEIRGSQFELLPERAAFWPEAQAIFCSDLHWGREAFLQRKGFAVPERSFEKEAQILFSAIARTQAKELWILGDFIHHPEGLHADLLARMKSWLTNLTTETSLKLTRLIPGNHDRKFAEWGRELPLEIHDTGFTRGDFVFLHEESDRKEATKNHFCWSGHLYPAVYPKLLGKEKLPCFWVRSDEAYLPAFSRMSAGMEIGTTKPSDRVYAIAGPQIFEL